MNVTHCKQTIKVPHQNDFVRRYPLHYLEPGSEIRSGFQKGTLKTATFKLHNGTILIYENLEE